MVQLLQKNLLSCMVKGKIKCGWGMGWQNFFSPKCKAMSSVHLKRVLWSNKIVTEKWPKYMQYYASLQGMVLQCLDS